MTCETNFVNLQDCAIFILFLFFHHNTIYVVTLGNGNSRHMRKKIIKHQPFYDRVIFCHFSCLFLLLMFFFFWFCFIHFIQEFVRNRLNDHNHQSYNINILFFLCRQESMRLWKENRNVKRYISSAPNTPNNTAAQWDHILSHWDQIGWSDKLSQQSSKQSTLCDVMVKKIMDL